MSTTWIGHRTHEDYVKFTWAGRKYYKAVLTEFGGLRLSRRTFARGRDAQEYRRQVAARLERMRAGVAQ